MHALEWIEQHGRFRRQLSASVLRRQLGRAKGHCTWCGQKVSGRRRTWCDETCWIAYRERCDPGYIRVMVERRDLGICGGCGVNTHEAHGLVNTILQALRDSGVCRRVGWQTWSKKCACLGCLLRKEWGQHYFEVDHVVPVVEGGGLCDLDGYRTLCIPCHRDATCKLRQRLKRKEAPRVRKPATRVR